MSKKQHVLRVPGITILYYNNKGYGYFKVNNTGISWKDTSRQVVTYSEKRYFAELFRYKTWIIRTIK